MRIPHIGLIVSTPRSTLVMSVWCGALILLLSSCGIDIPVQRAAQQGETSVLAPEYSIVCVVHGDGDYLYHDTTGTEYNADEVTVAGMKRVAEQNPRAEVFIFHQRPRGHLLLLFPLRDGEFYYYRNGALIANESYRRDEGRSRFEPEAALLQRFRPVVPSGMLSMFLYFGHEIPEFGGEGYDASYPDRPFTVRDAADGLKGLTRLAPPFDLMVLSTCYGGTPNTIGALGQYARTIIASPENLHLSYFDLRLLERLDLNLRNRDVPGYAKRFARHAFDCLTRNIQTAVSVAVYDADSVQEYVHSVQRTYDSTLTAFKGGTRTPAAAMEHRDCAEIPGYVRPAMNKGVGVLYRPPQFGRAIYKRNHSGWECWGCIETPAPSSQAAAPQIK